MKILVSACLLGCPCRYDGKSVPCEAVIRAADAHTLIPFCPEIYGGLATPRCPAERQNNRVVTRDGRDVTEEYERGARLALETARLLGCTHAVLKEKSPSCGSRLIYDGTFTGTLIPGEGVTAALLRQNGIRVLPASDVKI